MTVPSVSGVLSADQVRATAASIASMQEASGAIPWTVGQHVDIWNHVEAAMGLLAGGQTQAAERALDWVPAVQRADGSWPMRIVAGTVTDSRGETNMSAYFAVGLWHHWLVRGDRAYVARHWEPVRRGLDWVISQQADFGGIRWTPDDDFCLLAGNSSIFHSLRAGLALAALLDRPQPQWELAAGRIRHAIVAHRDRFADKSTFSMDWYYPALGGVVRGHEAVTSLDARWNDFVLAGHGVRCVDTNPWFTCAETCELVLTLDALGDHTRALALFADIQRLRDSTGAYTTGVVIDPQKGDVFWPGELTTYTAAAVILAADALGATRGRATGGSGIMRGDTLPEVAELATGCYAGPHAA